VPTFDHDLADKKSTYNTAEPKQPRRPQATLFCQPLEKMSKSFIILSLLLIAKKIAALRNLPVTVTMLQHHTPPILGLLNAKFLLCDYLYYEKAYII
jgi:hypothetical protein